MRNTLRLFFALACTLSVTAQEYELEQFPINRVESWNGGLLVMGQGEGSQSIKNEFIFIDSSGKHVWSELMNLTGEKTYFLNSPETKLAYFVEDMEEELELRFTQVYSTGYNKKKVLRLTAPIRAFRTDVDFSKVKLLEMHAAYYNLVMLFEYENDSDGSYEYFTILMSHNSFKFRTVNLVAAYSLQKESKKKERSRPTFLGTLNGNHYFGQWSNQERFSGQRVYTVHHKGELADQISFQWEEDYFPGVSKDLGDSEWNSYYGASGEERDYDPDMLDNWGGMKLMGEDLFVYGTRMQGRPGEKKNASTGAFVVRYSLNGSKIWSTQLDAGSGLSESDVADQSMSFAKRGDKLFLSIGKDDLSTMSVDYNSGKKSGTSQTKVTTAEAQRSILAPAVASEGKPISGGNIAEMDGETKTFTTEGKKLTLSEL